MILKFWPPSIIPSISRCRLLPRPPTPIWATLIRSFEPRTRRCDAASCDFAGAAAAVRLAAAAVPLRKLRRFRGLWSGISIPLDRIVSEGISREAPDRAALAHGSKATPGPTAHGSAPAAGASPAEVSILASARPSAKHSLPVPEPHAWVAGSPACRGAPRPLSPRETATP